MRILYEHVYGTSVNQIANSTDISYKCVSIQNKGMGLVAIRDIKKGEIIFEERPILKWKCKEHNGTMCYDFDELLDCYKHQFLKLPKIEQECIMKLYNAHPEGSLDAYNAILCNTKKGDAQLKEWIGIMYTNQFLDINDYLFDLYVKKSRFNHSCMPNVESHFVEEKGYERIYSLCDVTKGEELCIEYLSIRDTPPTIKNVNEDLKKTWKFECSCELCGMTDKEKRSKIESQRVKYRNARKQIDLPNKMKPEQRLKLCDELFKDMKIGDILYTGELGHVAKIGFYCALICGQQTKISFYIEQWYESQLITLGADHSNTKNLRLMKPMMQDRRYLAMQNMSSSSVYLEMFPEVERYLSMQNMSSSSVYLEMF